MDDAPRRLLAEYGSGLPPLLRDVFERSTFWTFTRERAKARSAAGGTWHVTLTVRGRKSVLDDAGVDPRHSLSEFGGCDQQ